VLTEATIRLIRHRRDALSRAVALRSLGLLAVAAPLGVVASLGAADAGTAAQTSFCVLTPAETEGPYFIDHQLERSDVRTDPVDTSPRPGVALKLTMAIRRLANAGCLPVAGACVDLWHADAFGRYSGIAGAADHSRYLRGYQRTDEAGEVVFTTIVPGWYPGRTVHIHFKVRPDAADSRRYEFTSQLYFDDALLDTIYRSAPYAARGPRNVRNEADGIFTEPVAHDEARGNGTELLLALQPADGGYAARFDVALDLPASQHE
jgi:protocatechuate 3,4-dioxygenase beta subunit